MSPLIYRTYSIRRMSSHLQISASISCKHSISPRTNFECRALCSFFLVKMAMDDRMQLRRFLETVCHALDFPKHESTKSRFLKTELSYSTMEQDEGYPKEEVL